MEQRRKWEEMKMDCLVNIFQRLGLEDLTVGVPFVCKSWYTASLDPLCWKILNFQTLDFMPWSKFAKRISTRYPLSRLSFAAFMKFAIDRSCGTAVELRLHPVFGTSIREDLFYVSNKCPRLKVIGLPNLMLEDEVHIPEIIGKWKELERLEMESKPSSFTKLAAQISLSCKNFSGLKMSGSIKKEDASAIVNYLPKVRYLDLSKSYLPKEELLAIMNGCKEIERLSVNDCIGFEAKDEEVLKWASGIKIFELDGSKLLDDFCYDTDECDPLYVDVI